MDRKTKTHKSLVKKPTDVNKIRAASEHIHSSPLFLVEYNHVHETNCEDLEKFPIRSIRVDEGMKWQITQTSI